MLVGSSFYMTSSNTCCRYGYRVDDCDDYDDFGEEVDDDFPCFVPAKQVGNTEEWIQIEDGMEVELFSGKTRDGLQLNIAAIPNSVLLKKDKFFACIKCGQMSWVMV
jgi:hypothetical protein